MHLDTPRLAIRPFVMDDAREIHRINDLTFGDGTRINDPDALGNTETWVQWNILNVVWHQRLNQPPYGELAVVRKDTGALVGAVGYTPCLDVFEQLPALQLSAASTVYATAEVGLFWAIDPAQQKRGIATEAGQALIDHAFNHMRVKRIIATTEYDNLASQAVMSKLGMRLERNPLPTPPWLQVVGVLNHP